MTSPSAPLDPRLTEQRNADTADVDLADPLRIVEILNREDRQVPEAVRAVRGEIARAIELVEAAFRAGGRLIYVGAGSSGRLGVLDAAECPPTFGTPPELVQGIIAGGARRRRGTGLPSGVVTGIFRTARAALPVLALQLQAGVSPTAIERAQAEPSRPPRVSVLPVFFVPRDALPPTKEQRAALAQHLRWTQRRYAELLGHRDSFVVEPIPLVYGGERALVFYRGSGEHGVPNYVAELLRHLGANRFTCPYVLLIVVMNDRDDFPPGGGGPLNGGIGTGGGVVVLSSYALDRHPNFQSTLQHELGHAFHLVHVDWYGEDMQTSRSLMSWNPAHHTNGFQASATPGELVPVDLVALSLNRRVFPLLAGDSVVTVPPATRGFPDLSWHPAMTIPGEPPNAVGTSTGAGERYQSAVRNIVQGRIRPSRGPGITFDAARMWHSDSAADGWVAVDLVFPVVVTLTGLGIHTEHSGNYHRAVEARVLAGGERAWREVARRALPSASCSITFGPTEAREWRVMLRAGESGSVVVRGLEFRSHGQDVYPPLVRDVAPAPPC